MLSFFYIKKGEVEMRKLSALLVFVVLSLFTTNAVGNDELLKTLKERKVSLGFHTFLPTQAGLSAKMDITQKTSAQVIVAPFGPDTFLSTRAIFNFEKSNHFNFYGFSAVDLVNTSFDISLGIGANYDLRGFDEHLPAIIPYFEMFIPIGGANAGGFGIGAHYRF